LGKGVSVNLSEAARYYKLSADQGNSNGQNRYGLCLELGKGVSVDLSEAARYYKLSADQGNSDGQFNYSRCFE
jgi:TPR repeat protein